MVGEYRGRAVQKRPRLPRGGGRIVEERSGVVEDVGGGGGKTVEDV